MSRPRHAEPILNARVPGLHRPVLALTLPALAAISTKPRAACAAFDPVFRYRALFDVGAAPMAVATGDLNGDGLPESGFRCTRVGAETPRSEAFPAQK
jgi:hypothetical protein